MKYLTILLLITLSFSECDELNLIQCSSNSDCEWIENIELGNCSDITNSSECYQTNQCSWYNAGNYGYWYDNCYGGTYEIDNSYCQENSNPPTCSEMNENECYNATDCRWINDQEWQNCSNFNDGDSCEANNDECSWEYGCIQWGWWYNWCYTYGYECEGGGFVLDTSYCEETDTDTIQGDLNGDTTLNILDVIILVDIILNGESSDLADINNDGMINILDVIELIDIIINT